MIDIHIAKSLAISFGVEDYSGLYELIWGLNSQYPEINQETKVRAADRAMRSLLDMGHIQFHESGPNGPTEQTMPTGKALGSLDDPSVWKPPLERLGLPLHWFTATDAGGDALERGEYSSL